MSITDIGQAIQSLADQIVSQYTENPVPQLGLIGIRSRGDEVAKRVGQELSKKGIPFQFGVLDISLYRDDLAHLHNTPQLKGSHLPFNIEGMHLLLVDDVLFTGRTARAAIEALMDYGRPQCIEFAVLFDRGHRELPIQPNFVGSCLETNRFDHVIVHLQNTDGEDSLQILPHST